VLVNVLNFNSSTIDFGTTGSTNHFLFNSAGTNTGTLTIANWTSGTDVFGVANGTVSQSFLDNLFFSNLNVGIGAVLSASPIAVGSYGNFYTVSPIPTFIWDGGQSSGPVASQDDWNQANIWSGNIAPAVGAMKAMVMAGSARLANDMNGAYQLNSLLFRSDAGAFTISSSTNDTLTVGGGGINNQSTSTQTLTVPLSLATSQTWTAVSGNLVFNGTSILNGAPTPPARSTVTTSPRPRSPPPRSTCAAPPPRTKSCSPATPPVRPPGCLTTAKSHPPPNPRPTERFSPPARWFCGKFAAPAARSRRFRRLYNSGD